MFGEIRNPQGERIDYTFSAGDPGAKRLLVIGHGVTGNKDRPFILALASSLAGAAIPTLRFSFAGNGASEGRFTESTISKEVADLGAVLDAVKGFEVGYAGHSMGGAVGVLRASQDARIRFLISLAGMVHTGAFAQREFGAVKPDHGFMWDDNGCPLSQSFMDDMSSIDSVAPKAKSILVPWLLIHGTEDDVVPIQDSKDILGQAGSNATFGQLEGVNHVFAGESNTAAMIAMVREWLKTHGW